MTFANSTVFIEGRHTGEYILTEANGLRSRDAAVIASGAGVIQPGTVLGAIAIGTAAAAVAAAGNKGNGTIGAPTLGPKAKVGTYQVAFTGATAYQVVNPKGEVLAPGTAPNTWGADQAGDEIAFAFTAGSTPMQAGDSFAIAVAPGSQKLLPCKATAVDGSEIAVAIAYAWSDATSVDVPATISARDTEVVGVRLTWDASIAGNPAALAAATAQLAAKGIILR